MNILFWNTGTGNHAPLNEIAGLVGDLRVDVLILAECPLSPIKLVEKLNPGARAEFHLPLNQSNRFTFVVALPPRNFTPVYDSAGVSAWHVKPPIGQDALVVALHLPSKLHLEEEEQGHLAPRTSQLIERLEKQIGHTRTIVIGDTAVQDRHKSDDPCCKRGLCALQQAQVRENNRVYTSAVVVWLMICQRLQAEGTLENAVLELVGGLPGSFWPQPCKRLEQAADKGGRGCPRRPGRTTRPGRSCRDRCWNSVAIAPSSN